jgi:prepilin-type N-terminal cleavage/methylation domain-containing protein
MMTRIRRTRSAFTLLELIIVVIILAALAGLLIPKIGMFGRSADMAASASSQSEIAKNLQQFFVLQKRFPQYMDSLCVSTAEQTPPITGDSDGDGYDDGLYLPRDSAGNRGDNCDGDDQVAGLPKSGPDLWKDLQIEDIGPAGGHPVRTYLRSFARSGFDYVRDHDDSIDNDANDSATFTRDVPGGKSAGDSFLCATVKDGSSLAEKLYPATGGTIPAGTKLVALGFGPGNTAIGKTAMQAPIYPGNDGSYYGRYVAIFQVFDSGERAVLVCVVDSYGRAPDYTQQQFNESLPNDARRG